jgi:hypothetical protein
MNDYTSSYTGAQIDAAVAKANAISATAVQIDTAVTQSTATVDYVVAQGTDNGWTYRKWNSGVAECWGKHDTPTMTMTANGSVYLSNEIDLNFPSGLFLNPPVCMVNVHAAGGLISAKATNGTTATYLRYQVVRTGDYDTATKIVCHAYGVWKSEE